MEQFTKESGGLSRGSVKLPKGENNPLKTHSGGLGGNTFKRLKPWIRCEIYEYEDGEKEWEREQIDQLNDEALGYDSDFSSNAGMIHSDSDSGENPTSPATQAKVFERINDQDAEEDLNKTLDFEIEQMAEWGSILGATPNTLKRTEDALRRGEHKRLSKSVTKAPQVDLVTIRF